MRFEVNLPLSGDIAVNLQHLQLLPRKRKRNVFRCSFHSGYVHGNSLLFPRFLSSLPPTIAESAEVQRARGRQRGCDVDSTHGAHLLHFVHVSVRRYVLSVLQHRADLCAWGGSGTQRGG